MTSILRILFCNISNNYNIPWWSFAILIAITILTVCFSNSIIKTNSGWVIFAIAIPKTIQAGALLRYQFQLQYQYYCRNAISEPIYLSIWYYCAALVRIVQDYQNGFQSCWKNLLWLMVLRISCLVRWVTC